MMNLQSIKNSDKYFWTEHAKFKMKFYGLSPQRVLRVIRAPQRVEEGIVANTIAVMQPTSSRMKDGKKIWSQEIWAMYQTRKARNPKSEIRNPEQIQNSQPKADPPMAEKSINYKLKTNQLKIISAWRYPGMSPKNNPIPREILEELDDIA